MKKNNTSYHADILCAIQRNEHRKELYKDDLHNIRKVKFYGIDIWNIYELSWLDITNKPEIRIAALIYNADSEFLIESKSLKMYFNSFNNTVFKDESIIKEIIIKDISTKINSEVYIKFYRVNIHYDTRNLINMNNINLNIKNLFDCQKMFCLDDIKINTNNYANTYITENFEFNNRLKHLTQSVSENLSDYTMHDTITKNFYNEGYRENMHKYKCIYYTNLFRSSCPITGQPDWCTMFIACDYNDLDDDIVNYNKINNQANMIVNPENLLKYLLSFRNHGEFHEHCVERIFIELMNQYSFSELVVYARYTRRGGIDINPLRTNMKKFIDELFYKNDGKYDVEYDRINYRLVRQ